MKRMLFLILMNSRRTEVSSQQHKGVLATTNQNFPWIAAVLCLKRETISVSLLSFWSLLPLGSLDQNLRLQIWAGSCCTLVPTTLGEASWLAALCNKKTPLVSAGSDASKWASAEAELCSGTSEEQQGA